MRSFLAGLRQLVLPWGAGPGRPRAVYGPDVPAELRAYYAAPFSLVFARVYYSAVTNTYEYEGILDNSNTVVRGWYFASGGGVIETYRHQINGADHVSHWFGPSGTTKQIDLIHEGAGEFHAQGTGGFWFGPGTPIKVGFGGAAPFVRTAGRGLVTHGNISTAVGASAAEQTLTSVTATFQAGHAYEVQYRATVQGSASPMAALFRARRNNIAGALRGEGYHPISTGAGGWSTFGGDWRIVNRTAADVTDALLLTLTPTNAPAGTTLLTPGGTTRMTKFELWDIGDAADYPTDLGM